MGGSGTRRWSLIDVAKTMTLYKAPPVTRRGLTGATLMVTCQVACVRQVDGGLSGTTLIDHLPYCTRETAQTTTWQ